MLGMNIGDDGPFMSAKSKERNEVGCLIGKHFNKEVIVAAKAQKGAPF